MKKLLEHYPGAQRALFRRYHIGGCASCGFSPDETLGGVCARNENLDVDEVTARILASDAADRAMQIEPRELSERLAAGETNHFLDIRTREEFDSVKLPESAHCVWSGSCPAGEDRAGAPGLRPGDPMFDPLRNDPRFEKIVASLAPKDSASTRK